MRPFQPDKLAVTYLPPATPFSPIDSRKYTLTHSDDTGKMVLSIGYRYDQASINPRIRDEVMAEWIPRLGEYTLWGKVYVSGGEFDEKYSQVRYLVFQKELDLTLRAMINGDQDFYTYYPWLVDAPIYIQFDSDYPEFQKIIYYGTPRHYLWQSKEKQSTAD